jgi:hypothetical protein
VEKVFRKARRAGVAMTASPIQLGRKTATFILEESNNLRFRIYDSRIEKQPA